MSSSEISQETRGAGQYPSNSPRSPGFPNPMVSYPRSGLLSERAIENQDQGTHWVVEDLQEMDVSPVQWAGSLATVKTMSAAICVPMQAMSAKITMQMYHRCRYPLT